MPDLVRIPIIKLYDTVIVSIQVELSDALVLRLKDDIAAAIERSGPRGLIIDVSGVAVMDSYISRTIRDIGIMSKYMGVSTVICGLDANVAMTLVEMGMGFEGVTTKANLEAALESFQTQDDIEEDEDRTDEDLEGSDEEGASDEDAEGALF